MTLKAALIALAGGLVSDNIPDNPYSDLPFLFWWAAGASYRTLAVQVGRAAGPIGDLVGFFYARDDVRVQLHRPRHLPEPTGDPVRPAPWVWIRMKQRERRRKGR